MVFPLGGGQSPMMRRNKNENKNERLNPGILEGLPGPEGTGEEYIDMEYEDCPNMDVYHILNII
jgi:hypothetical protein